MDDILLPDNLVYVCDSQPGISRKRQGRGFSYFDKKGDLIKDAKIIKRIKGLVIPPAWEDVWICAKANGYLQATGRDDRKRKQYRYHPDWEAFSNQNKYGHLLEFADLLPALRRRYRRDLRREKWDRRKVLGLAVALMDELALRIGNKYYSRENNSYGLTTLRRKHVQFDNHTAHINFVGKKGVEQNFDLEDKKLSKLLKECSELPGYELFRYEDEEGYRSIDSSDFNEYINSLHKGNGYVTSKDFRTWGGTILCVHYEKEAARIVDENPRKKKEPTLVGLVAERLGNTVATCRKYYIHPKVLEYCVQNSSLSRSKKSVKRYSEYYADEQMVLEILNE